MPHSMTVHCGVCGVIVRVRPRNVTVRTEGVAEVKKVCAECSCNNSALNVVASVNESGEEGFTEVLDRPVSSIRQGRDECFETF